MGFTKLIQINVSDPNGIDKMLFDVILFLFILINYVNLAVLMSRQTPQSLAEASVLT
jgi:hypothetical protein